METMFHFIGALNRFVDVLATNKRQEGHHLLDGNERVFVIGLAKEHFNVGRNVLTNTRG